MPLIIGVICLALGISLAVAWWSVAFLKALEVLLVLLLLVCGLIQVLVAYSDMKAARGFAEALAGDTGTAAVSPDSSIPTASALGTTTTEAR